MFLCFSSPEYISLKTPRGMNGVGADIGDMAI